MARDYDRALTEMLVLLAQQGEREALERLAARWRPRHYAHARRLLGATDGAADAVQEAWAGIVRGIGGLREPGRFPAWSYAIVTRRCHDTLRRKAREPLNVPDYDAPDPASVPGAVNGADTVDLRRAMAGLPPDQRATVALFYGDGMSVNDIAVALRVPAGTVKTRLFHARRFLRRQLEGDDNEQA